MPPPTEGFTLPTPHTHGPKTTIHSCTVHIIQIDLTQYSSSTGLGSTALGFPSNSAALKAALLVLNEFFEYGPRPLSLSPAESENSQGEEEVRKGESRVLLHVEIQAPPVISAQRLYRLVERCLVSILALGRQRRREAVLEGKEDEEGDVVLGDLEEIGGRVVLIPGSGTVSGPGSGCP